MRVTNAFVGHSFSSEDEAVVRKILDFLTALQNTLPGFHWSHAEAAAPKELSDKVVPMMREANTFIAICTKSEQVIVSKRGSRKETKRAPLHPKTQWKTSDWIIQEIGLAIGMNHPLVLLVEDGLRLPGGLQGNVNYITFDRSKPEVVFKGLVEMISSLSPKETPSQAAPAAAPSQEKAKEEAKTERKEETQPREDWSQNDYDGAIIPSILFEDKQRFDIVNKAYRASQHFLVGDKSSEWEAKIEYFKLLFHKDGDLAKLRILAENNLKSSKIWTYLAQALSSCQEYGESAKAFEYAASISKDVKDNLDVMADMAIAYAKSDRPPEGERIIDKVRSRRAENVISERDFLVTLRNFSESLKEPVQFVTVLERILERDPLDISTRFALAYKYSEIGEEKLALFHYLKIPPDSRTAMAWNNLGVSFDGLQMPIKAVKSYRISEQMGETLAVSNLINKLISSGFLAEAAKLCDTTLQIKDYDKRVLTAMARLKTDPEAETQAETNVITEVKQVSAFYANAGEALLHSKPDINVQLRDLARKYILDVSVVDMDFVASAYYEVEDSPLFAFMKSAPARWEVTYRGKIRGRTVEGGVVREKAESKGVSSVLNYGNTEIPFLMLFAEDGKSCRVMEGKKAEGRTFYELSAP